MYLTRLLPLALSLWFGAWPLAATCADEPTPPSEYGLSVGKKMPFHVADFVNGQIRQGCPSKMISNANGRGVIVWTRGDDAVAFRLAKALDGKAVDGKNLRGFLVAFDQAADKLQEKATGLENLIVGKARTKSQAEFEARGLDAETQIVAFFLDRKDIKAMWSLRASELNDAKIDELAKKASDFAAENE